ncbi:MAG TPA: thioredoxin-like domain-containing protein [Thermomicrobiales bacterium]|jgi:sugar lactone lactonase YvrE/thiol-disulfide isomerase/thioredoxin|nr:thioredoxin-like domain-containing protein [Thermomicrobiales bacterium]
MTMSTMSYRGSVRAPDFRGYEWVQGAPRTLADLRGQLVILDFFTYCCINCMHMLPALHRLEAEFAGQLTVIGVESAKFTAEQDPANVARAIARYGISHPVINDPERTLWDQYAVRAWPTLMFIDPAGRVWGSLPGEISYDALRMIVVEALASYKEDGSFIVRQPEQPAPDRESGGALRFPGKVIVDAPHDRLIVSDTGHHRILVMGRDGHVTTVIGSGSDGFADGPLDPAAFSRPEGTAITADGRTLFVADRANHRLRRVALDSDTVTTVAGTGERGSYQLDGPAPGTETALASPWDLAWHGERLLMAMAGTHQIWSFDPATGLVDIAAGTGAESIHDGPLREATFAQPSGIVVAGDTAWALDSESSSVRRLDLTPGGRVRRVVGRGLFDFGDRDGTGDAARLQHPLGLAGAEEDGQPVLYLADSYNHRIKRLDPATRTVTTIAGSGEAGRQDGDLATAAFWEPSGLAVDGRRIWVADTNNHALRLLDLDAGTVVTVDVRLP